MATEIKMPQLSDTMDSGKIITWLKNEGDKIARGDILAEVETDKANLEIESFDEGVLVKILTPANQSAKVGEAIAVLGKEGEAVESSRTEITTPIIEKEVVQEQKVESPKIQETISQTISHTFSSISDRIKASPLAKKIASEKNIDLSSINGSGPNGRIIKKDLDSSDSVAQSTVANSPSSEVKTSRKTTGPLTGKIVEVSKMRATIAKRMQESVLKSPHFFMTAEINMTEAIKLRETLKVKDNFKGLSLNHFIIKACGVALENEPSVNSTMTDEGIFVPDQINIGIITAVDNGLLIPVLKEVNKLKLMEVASETRELINRARSGSPSSSDLSGGTFSISNMGMFDVDNFTAIINPGQGAILAVSAMKETPIVENGQIKVAQVMKVTLSSDHRIIDGVGASQFLKHFKEALEIPALLLV